ncbi:MAG: D-alanyl-D-alanine carboxypeptidase [Firmicutes bacterium]|nr:D-alanyl-D-alanine carboxypeptidase [Bacillota bacterium]
MQKWKNPTLGIILLFIILAFSNHAWALSADDLDVEAAILLVADTGQILVAKNIDKQMEPASITKVMTMLLALEAVERGESALTDEIRVSPEAEAIGGSQVWLRAGEVFTLEEMLKAVAIQSANDAAYAVAEHVAGSVPAFVRLMNRRATELGMDDTYFANVHGLPAENGEEPSLTTVEDITKMTRAILEYPVVLKWTSTWREVFRSNEPQTILHNTNYLLRDYPGVDGLKTGHTNNAGYCLVATAERDDLRLISVVMNASSDTIRRRDSRRLFDYGFKGFISQNLVPKGTVIGESLVKNGRPERVNLVAVADLAALIEKGSANEWGFEIELKPGLAAPLAAGEIIGYLAAQEKGLELGRVPVTVQADVKVANGLIRLWRWIRDTTKSFVKVGDSV